MATLGRWNRTIQDAAGNVANATVTVYKESDGLLATIYSDRAGATLKSNPFTLSNSDYGLAFFHAAGGAYKVVAVSGSYSQTWRYEPVGTGAEFDADSLSGVIPPTTTVAAAVRIAEATNNGINYVQVTVPVALSANYTFTLPAADVTMSTFITTLLDDASAGAARTTLGAVNTAGDTMTGDLVISKSLPALTLTRSANNQYAVIYWSDPSSVSRWALTGNNDSQYNWLLNRFNSSGVYQDTPFTVSGADGSVTLAKILTLTAGQLSFPASQNASAGANVLDDHEEGTHTPGLTLGGAAVGMTFAGQYGNYQKTGQLVMSSSTVQLSAKGSSTGQAAFTGLPFTAGTGIYNGYTAYYGGVSSLAGAPSCDIASSTTRSDLWMFGASGAAQITNSNVTNSSDLRGTQMYRASA